VSVVEGGCISGAISQILRTGHSVNFTGFYFIA
jgi:hypothetical protein